MAVERNAPAGRGVSDCEKGEAVAFRPAVQVGPQGSCTGGAPGDHCSSMGPKRTRNVRELWIVLDEGVPMRFREPTARSHWLPDGHPCRGGVPGPIGPCRWKAQGDGRGVNNAGPHKCALRKNLRKWEEEHTPPQTQMDPTPKSGPDQGWPVGGHWLCRRLRDGRSGSWGLYPGAVGPTSWNRPLREDPERTLGLNPAAEVTKKLVEIRKDHFSEDERKEEYTLSLNL